MAKTIAQNRTAKIADIFAKATKVISYSLSSNFAPTESTADWAQKALTDYRGKLVDNGQGKYQIQFHSNWWMEITSAG